MEHKPEPKWSGKACAELKGSKADQVWLLFEDFFSIDKWLPGIDTCLQVHGVSGEPGCIRYCASSSTSASSDGSTEKMTCWATERLLAIDRNDLCLSYEVVDSNMGFKAYVATIKVLQDDKSDQDQCNIEWSFEADPVEGWRLAGLVSYVESSLQAMTTRMEKALLTSK
ncbi:Lachrymatory-factor synthase [Thalictrum thalictroides]|uniref:Lachrymatory-factor synthase n=1 Tax=Thalictrum thalictroides TaxID=46969 RepID=A0A7J6WG91_THATH|nr:Lachrymatory-factor synthase [Thalictrum thalictroides]